MSGLANARWRGGGGGNGDGVRTGRSGGKVFIEMKKGKERDGIEWFLFRLRGGFVFGD